MHASSQIKQSTNSKNKQTILGLSISYYLQARFVQYEHKYCQGTHYHLKENESSLVQLLLKYTKILLMRNR